MKATFIKYEKDYRIPRLLGMNIEEISKPEEIDNKIEELKKQTKINVEKEWKKWKYLL